MTKLQGLLLLMVGIINFLPVMGVLSAGRLSQAYGIEVVGNDLEILLRHRALLFGIIGGFVLYSLFVPGYQVAAMVLAGLSMVGFLVVLWLVGGYNAALHKVMVADLVGIVCLAGAVVCRYLGASDAIP